jgi:hypothetical protein
VSTPITNVPQGLLSLLGLRDFGAVPRFMPETVQAGIDVTQFLLLNRETVQGTVTFNSLSSDGPAATLVPAGELWYVHSAQAQSATLAVGETIQLVVGLGTGAASIAQSDPQRATAGHRCAAWLSDYWLPPGGSIVARTMEITTAATITVTVTAWVTKLRI